MNTNAFFFLLTLYLFVSLTACQSTITPTPTTTADGVDVSTASVTATILINLTPTLTVSPTIEVVHETPSPLPTSTQTPLPSPTPDLQATLVATVIPVTFASYPSPDGAWQADMIVYDCTKIRGDGSENAYEEFRMMNIASGETIVVDNQFLNCGGLGAFGLEGIQWSPDSRFFYYTPTREGVPDGCGYYVPGISRYDVALDEIISLGYANVAPDGNRYVSWNWDEKWILQLWSMDSGEIQVFEPHQPTAEAGPIAWSPDGSEFIYLQRTYQCTEEGTAWLVRVNAETLEQEVVLETEEYHLWSVQWNESDTLTLGTIGFENYKTYVYDLTTGMIEEQS